MLHVINATFLYCVGECCKSMHGCVVVYNAHRETLRVGDEWICRGLE